MTATLTHIERKIEYYKNDSLFCPSAEEKLLWSLFGTPDNITKIEQNFETDIDVLVGFTKREIEAKLNQNFADGNYKYLPAIGFNDTLELRYGS
jgi:hypothetical protein